MSAKRPQCRQKYRTKLGRHPGTARRFGDASCPEDGGRPKGQVCPADPAVAPPAQAILRFQGESWLILLQIIPSQFSFPLYPLFPAPLSSPLCTSILVYQAPFHMSTYSMPQEDDMGMF